MKNRREGKGMNPKEVLKHPDHSLQYNQSKASMIIYRKGQNC